MERPVSTITQRSKRKSELDTMSSGSEESEETRNGSELDLTSFSSPLNSALIESNKASSVSEPEPDYDAVSSPGNSSTSSGPIARHVADCELHDEHNCSEGNSKGNGNSSGVCVKSNSSQRTQPGLLNRQPLSGLLSATKGVKKKKWPTASALSSASSTTRSASDSATHTRGRSRREPLPMKQRALPQSFWQQPNVPSSQPPGIMCGATLPPLPLTGDDELTPIEDVTAINTGSTSASVTISSSTPPTTATSMAVTSEVTKTVLEVEPAARSRGSERYVSVADTDLLFSLFNNVEEDETQRRIHVVRRGRPKKSSGGSLSGSKLPRDDNPCLNATVMESILPLIPEKTGNVESDKNSRKSTHAAGTQVIKILSISDGENTVELPSLNVEHNYPHLLSELVMKL